MIIMIMIMIIIEIKIKNAKEAQFANHRDPFPFIFSSSSSFDSFLQDLVSFFLKFQEKGVDHVIFAAFHFLASLVGQSQRRPPARCQPRGRAASAIVNSGSEYN
jgi:hypothetical protein